jgi:DNA polymerase-3 subunit epsilon
MGKNTSLRSNDLTVIDLELTDLDLDSGARVVALGAVRLARDPKDDIAREWFFNPEGRAVGPDGLRIHGLRDEFLATQRTFKQSYFDIALFLGKSRLVHHCWTWKDGPHSTDEVALNNEFTRAAQAPIAHHRFINLKTVARALSPDQNSLNDMMDRYNIDRTDRAQHHGAKLDAVLTAKVLRSMMQDTPACRMLRTMHIE